MGAQVGAACRRTCTQSSGLGSKAAAGITLLQTAPHCSLLLAAGTARLQTRATDPVLSSDYRDKRWALSVPCNTNGTIILLRSAEWGVLHNLPCVCEGTGLGTASGRLQMPVHFSHTGPPSDSSLWYGDCLPGDKSPCTGSSGGERR